jgi:HEAT repeat protein
VAAAVFISSVAVFAAQSAADHGWDVLKAGVADNTDEKRAKAVRALGLIVQNARAQELAEKAMQDAKPQVRVAAATALGQMGAKSSAGKLADAIKSDDSALVFAAANALYVLGDPRCYQVYYAVLTGEKKSGEGLVESQMKMLKDPKALAKLGFDSGIGFIPFGGAAVQAFKTVTKDDSSPVRAAAAQKLIRDSDPKTREALGRMLSDKKWMVRAAVVDAVAKRDDTSLLSAVLPLLSDENDTVRLTAAATVVRLSAKQ